MNGMIFECTEQVLMDMQLYNLQLGKWYHWDNTLTQLSGPFDTEVEATESFNNL